MLSFRLVSAFKDKILLRQDFWYYQLSDKLHGNFSLFAKHVINELEMCPNASCHVDCHFQPFTRRCPYCELDYEIIGKTETFEEDISYVLEKQNLSYLLPAKGNVKKMNSADGTEKSAVEFFQELEKEDREKLFHIYKLDFEMFGYDVEPYLN